MKNRVSVIIPTYNRSALICKAVESAFAAIIPGDEVLVIDDGSTDNTAEVLHPYRDKIRYIRRENAGPGAARNLGIKLSERPLVTFLDSDDEWVPDKLYLQRAVMDQFPVVFSFTNVLARLPNGEIVHNILDYWRNDPWVGYENEKKESWENLLGSGALFSSVGGLPPGRSDFNVYIGDIYAKLMEVYYIWTSSIMVRKEAAGASFRFAEDQNICEDWECFALLAKAGPAAYLDSELAVQNVHQKARLTDVGNIHQATARIKLLNRVWGADEAFLELHSELFRSVLRAQYLRRARDLISEGRIREAKEDLRAGGGGPWSWRVLTSLPLPLIEAILGMRRRFQRIGSCGKNG